MTKLNPNQIKLSDGRIATMKETNGRDEIAASQMLGTKFTADGAGQTMFTKALVMRAVDNIDGKPAWNGQLKLNDFMNFWGSISTKDGGKLMKKYQQMNGDEDPLDENEVEAESDNSQTQEVLES
jgi:hypothetical protein